MATEPTNKLIRIAELDTTLPIAGGPNKIEPESRILSTGYDDDNAVFAQDLNYTFDNLGQWVQYLVDSVGELKDQIIKERVSVGEIIEITGDSTNPSVLKGYGTWESFGQGQVLVGAGSHTDDRSESKSWIDGQTEGEYRHVQTESELATHDHAGRTDNDTHFHDYSKTDNFSGKAEGSSSDLPYTETIPDNGDSSYGVTGGVDGSCISIKISNTTDTTSSDEHNHPFTTNNTGSSSPMNNLQPSLAVYRWKRTA